MENNAQLLKGVLEYCVLKLIAQSRPMAMRS